MRTNARAMATDRNPLIARATRMWCFKELQTDYSEEYTLVMAKMIQVQIHGVENAVSVRADQAKEEMTGVNPVQRLVLSLNGVIVGDFKSEAVDGWWIDDAAGPGAMAL